MTFVAQIKADASGFVTTVDQAATKLTGLEERARSWAEVARAAAEQAAAAHVALNEKLGGVSSAFNSLTAAIKREQDMLGQIHGPMQRYERDLQTLDVLLGKGTISTNEYAEQVRKLNQQLEHTQTIRSTATDWTAHVREFTGMGGGGGHGGESENMLGKLGSKLGGLGGAGLLMAGGEIFAGVEAAKGLAELSDSYTETGNKLRTLAHDQGDFNGLMSKTLDIAQESRSDWNETASVFQRLSNATRSLGLSEDQVLGLTKEMAEASKLSGASSQEAAMSMMELSHAFSVGTLMAQSFKVLMKDSSVMMHELQVGSGMTQEEFEQLGMSGKITAQDLAQWFGKAAADIQVKFEQTHSTWSELWTGMKNDMEAAAGWVSDNFRTYGRWGSEAWHAVDDAWSHYVTHVKSSSDIDHEIAKLAKEHEDLTAKIAAETKVIRDADEERIRMEGLIGGTVDSLSRGGAAWDALAVAIGAVKERLNELMGIQSQVDTVVSGADAERVAMEKQLEVTDATIKRLGGAANMGALSGTAATALEKALEDQAKYESVLKGYGSAVANIRQEEIKRTESIRELTKAIADGVGPIALEKQQLKELEDQETSRAERIHKLTAYEQEQKRILDDINGARDRFNLGMEASFDLYAHGTISLQQYRQELEKLQADWNKAQPPPPSVIQAIGFTPQVGPGPASLPPVGQDPKKLTEQWNKEIEAFQQHAKKIGSALQQLFDPVVAAIDGAIKTGTLDFKQLGAEILDTFEQMILKALEFKAISAIIGMPYGSGGASGLSSLLSFATGGDVTIPHAATGWSGTIAGTGPTDSQLFMARVTPGEHVSIRTPEQMAAAQRTDARPVQVIVQDGGDPRAITAAFASKEFERHVVRVLRKTGRN